MSAPKLPAHSCGLSITHNEHRNYYEAIALWIDEQKFEPDELTEQERAECISTDSIWVLHWYPHTAIGFCRVAAPTLEALLLKAGAI